jgi:pimeloyl-ACP methyl ester carboxylesterase
MAVEVDGEGPPVIALHGLGGTSNTFAPQLGVLRRHRVIRPDLPGSGRSRGGQQVSVQGFVDAVIRMARVLGVESALFLGHSLGTIVCQHLAVQAPRLVRAMALFGALPAPPDAGRDGLRARAARARSDGMSGIAAEIAAGSVARATQEENPAAFAFVRESLMRQDPEGYAQTCEALAAAVPAEAGRIICPTLLVNGEDDAVAPPSVARSLAERLSGARVVILNRCGHWPTIERPREANEALRAFLSR